MEPTDPCAGLGNCDGRVARSLKPFFSLFLQPQQEFVDGLIHLLLVRSGIRAFYIMRDHCWSGADCAGGGSGMSRQELRKPEYTMPVISQVILGYHDMIIDIPGYFEIISHVIFKFETSNQVKLEYLILNMHIPV